MDLMALITRTYLVDDLDGSEDDVSTVTFTLDRTNYEIDLSASNADRLREKLEKFVNVASPGPACQEGGCCPTRRQGGQDDEDSKAAECAVWAGSDPGRAGLGAQQRARGVRARPDRQIDPGSVRRGAPREQASHSGCRLQSPFQRVSRIQTSSVGRVGAGFDRRPISREPE